MTVDAMLLSTCAGAALLALWIDARFPALAPSDLGRALLRLVLVLALGQLVPPAIVYALGTGVSRVVALLGLALPALVLLFLGAVWVMRALQGSLVGHRE